MKYSIYIYRDCKLKRKDNTLYIELEDGENQFVPVKQVRDIFNVGNISLNDRILGLCSKENISVHFFNYYGHYIGSFLPKKHYNNSRLLIKQVNSYTNKDERLFIAKKFLKSNIYSKLYMLNDYRKFGEGIKDIKDKLIYFKFKVEEADNLKSLIGYEANIQREYYKCFDLVIKNKYFRFEKRTKRPCKNELNAMISFGNTLLYSTVLSEICKTGLDYRISYIHTNNDRGYNLNLDIADIFKSVIVDKIIINSINLKVLSKKDFRRDKTGVWLSKSGMKKFTRLYDEKLAEVVTVNDRSLIRSELYKIQAYLKGQKDLNTLKLG